MVGQIAEDRIVLEQMGERLCVGDVVHRNKLNIFVVERGAHNVASDAAETVDTYLDGHSSSDGMVTQAGRPRLEIGPTAN